MRFKMLQGHHLAVMETQTVDEFRDHVIRFAHSLEFDTVGATTVIDYSPVHTHFHIVDNTPDAYRHIAHDPEEGRLDPVMQHCKNSSVPIIWDQDTYVAKGRGHIWEAQASYGFKTGIALALHLPGDLHFLLGTDRDKPLPANPVHLTLIAAELQLFAVHAQVAGLRIFALDSANATSKSPLTPRELEALRWTMDGKLAWEVGELLNVSARTAVFHLQNATRKLGCKSKFQAVLKAIQLGLLK